MRKGLIIALAVALVLGLAAGMASATVVQSNTVNTTGKVTVTQWTDAPNVVFWNDLTVNGDAGPLFDARLIFDQTIVTPYGTFRNDVDITNETSVWDAGVLKIMNFAAEQHIGYYEIPVPGTDIPVYSHRQVSFDQDVLMENSQVAFDGGDAKQVFTHIDVIGKYIEQQVVVEARPSSGIWLPDTQPDTMDLWDSGAGDDWFGGQGQRGVMNSIILVPQAGGRAQLYQSGQFRGEVCAATQTSNIGGPGVFTTGDVIPVYANDAWTGFTQIIRYE